MKLPTRVFDPSYGRRVIERRAWNCLERCRNALGLGQIQLPIPVEQWIESPLGFHFGFADLSYLGEGVLGATFIREREILIDEQVIDHDGRCRFTCAHELGHMLLHQKVRPEFHETSDLGPGSDDMIEREADRFAAAFLMPLPLVEAEVIKVFDECRMDRVRCTWELMQTTRESEWMWRKLLLPMLTRRFGVSLSTAINRCNDIEPRIPSPRPLLPAEFVESLLHRSVRGDELDAIRLRDGVPQYADLFTPASSDPEQ
ncbi:MAG: ImmA/IrrE family metallo-endopeptidase [Phycisphaerae bacterium]|nr:ImmA/IrrE family metallo-endopeptidase [Phycisphaerae bacterium]